MEYNEAQLKAININDGNTAVIATAGSGKTAVITKRIERLITDNITNPENILAVTFSRKARENIENRLSAACNGVNVETFHSLALKIVQSTSDGKYKLWTAQWEKEKFLSGVCLKKGWIKNEKDLPFNAIMRFIAKQKTEMRDADNLCFDAGLPFSDGRMKYVYIAYEDYKKRNNLIEFDDLLNMVVEIFNDNPDVLLTYQKHYRYILVDEFQDVSLNQALFLKQLSAKNNNLFVVGDGCQAIYQFRGGKSEYLLNFDDEWSDVSIVNLNTNYRCSKDIVTTANKLAESMPEGSNKHYVEAVANKGENIKPVLNIYGDVEIEAKEICKSIKRLLDDGIKAGDIAILTRTNAQLANLEQELVNNLIPCERTNSASFLDLMEIKLVLCYIKLADNTSNNEAFEFIYNKPLRWLDKKFLAEVEVLAKKRKKSMYDAMQYIDRRNWRFKNGIDEILDVINALQNRRFESVGHMIKYLRERLGIDDFISKGKQADDGSNTEEIENLDNFQNMCYKFKTVKELKSFVKALKSNEKDEDNKNKVHLMTIHKAKGLEFPVVFIAGVSQGILPHQKAEDKNDEKRLFYVAITRAMDRLYMSSPLFRNGNMLCKSEFITDLGDTIDIAEIDDEENEDDSESEDCVNETK